MSGNSSDSFRNVTKYLGQDYRFAPSYIRTRDPTANDLKPKEQQGFYPISSLWTNTTNNTVWVLMNFGTLNGQTQAIWDKLATGSVGPIEKIGVPNGTSPITPDANGLVNFTSTAGSVTITGSAGGLGAQNINLDLSIPALIPWTPTLFGSTVAGSTVYAARAADYKLIDRVVFAQFFVTGTTTGASGNVVIGGLPFPSASSSNCFGSAIDVTFTWPTNTTSICLILGGGLSAMNISASGSGVAFSNVQISDITFNVQGSIFYPI